MLNFPSETWLSLLDIGLAAHLARKVRESAQGQDDTSSTGVVAAAAAQAGTMFTAVGEETITTTTTATYSYYNYPIFLIAPEAYASSQSNWLLNANLINTFVLGGIGYASDGSAGGVFGEATVSGGLGGYASTDTSGFMSESTFSQDVSTKVGDVVRAGLGVAMMTGVGFTFGLAPGLVGLATTAIVKSALSSTLSENKWGTWSSLWSAIKAAFGFGEEATEAIGWGINGEMGYSNDMMGMDLGMSLESADSSVDTGDSGGSDGAGGDGGDGPGGGGP